jgi:type VI secretion system protein ImpM
VGFFGKIPARGDFVRAGLPRSFVDPWDEWLSHAIAGSRERLGARWLPAWMEAPIWYFSLPAGQCGPAPVLGVWMPSVDAAGRHFPLTLARIGALPADQDGWLAAAEAIGLDALQHDLVPEELARRLAELAAPPGLAAAAAGQWWTEGSPFVPAGRLSLDALPDAAAFAAMLHAVPCSESEEQPAGPPGAGGVRE